MAKKLSLVLLFIFLAGLLVYTFYHLPGRASLVTAGSAEGSRYALVDINKAGSKELETLPSIGPVAAQRIIDYRNQNGGFKNTAELTEVKGIGKKTYEKLKNKISVGDSK